MGILKTSFKPLQKRCRIELKSAQLESPFPKTLYRKITFFTWVKLIFPLFLFFYCKWDLVKEEPLGIRKQGPSSRTSYPRKATSQNKRLLNCISKCKKKMNLILNNKFCYLLKHIDIAISFQMNP
jgi:hypothetical protein